MSGALADLRAETWRLMALGQRLPAFAWDEPSRCTDWTVSDVFAHLAGDFLRYSSWLEDALRGDVAPPFDRGALAADNALLLDDFTGVPAPQRLEAFERAVTGYLEVLGSVDPSLPQGNPLGTITVGDQIIFATMECAIHGWDIASALNLPWTPPASIDSMVEAFRRHRDEPIAGPDLWYGLLVASGRSPEPA